MRASLFLKLGVVAATLGLSLSIATAQTPSASQENAGGAAALKQAAELGKYTFVFFHRTDDSTTKSLRSRIAPQAKSLADKALLVEVNITDSAEKALVDRFDVSRAPMPLVLAVAPTGAVTRHWFLDLNKIQLSEGFVSPAQAHALKALQDGKVVLVCVQNEKTKENEAALAGVKEFLADPEFAESAIHVMVDPADKAEATMLKQLGVATDTQLAVTVMMGPPAKRIATYEGATTKDAIVTSATATCAGCAEGKGCCPPAIKKKPKSTPPVDTMQ